MSSFLEELWNSIFTPGPTPTLLIATNAAFAALQFLLLILLVATYSIHFVVLSVLCGGLWYSINWFAAEIAQAQQVDKAKEKRSKSPETENASDTETESTPPSAPDESVTAKTTSATLGQTQTHERPKQSSETHLEPSSAGSTEALRRRRSLGESSGYISTDSEWEKISEGEEKNK
ncbi:SMK killer toxin resistance protein [Elasticomyces elasticus]|uniref:SMK killer toxin resistance protein n=1 Tax=Exophiala sideris TaxID=1016849 RepID=A0ABR0JJ07_9EURO|nr:SMK killer toxin resistance protein [Elasticomyces elasticus]KAK5030310.1 SMK killer toxin resistance protein [Exophiala sideris]KAK5035035.1 SMK killer toxin resistance protein [Exophiala sideris]KAK5065958.1 SMK killer toxin resistance protein [Exophiala sideris]KAK5178375.1 SMK killer toxin resistance protein [Eurotiomycetes sp. CCFEE 6388]